MSHESGRGGRELTSARRRALWIVAAFLLVDAVAGLLAVTVLPRLGLWAGPGESAPTSDPSRPAARPELVGYPVLNGNQGFPIAVGRPWGAACTSISLATAPGTPEFVRDRLGEVIDEAAAGGVPVLGAVAPGSPPVPVVQVAADPGSAPVLADGRPQQVLWFLQTELDAATRSETIRGMSTAVFVQATRDDVAQRRALRTLLARSFGLAGSTGPGSGLTAELGASVDGFSAADLAALRTMAGCG